MSLKDIVEKTDTTAGKVFDLFIQFLIVLSLIAFTFETLPNLDTQTQNILRIIEVVTVIIFTFEYILRIAVTDKKFGYIFSFYGMIDIIAILPFYLTTGIDLRSIRVFRLFRLFRVFKILKYSKAFDSLKIAFKEIRDELIVFFIAMLFIIYVSAVGIYYFENQVQPELFKSVIHCFWWAITSLTTVGYGDMYPITLGGKIFTSIVLIVGIGIVAVPTGLFASAITKTINR